jgi:hypothetical protein
MRTISMIQDKRLFSERFLKAIEADRGSPLGYVRLVGRRHAAATLAEHVVAVPTQYTKKPLLRSEEG